PRRRHGFWLLVTTAIATSLDAMAVGVGLAFLQVNIIATALAIGCATLIMSTLGMMVGRFIGSIIGKKAEILGGRMIIEGFRGADDEDEEPRRRHGFWLLVTTAIATSLDAMAVGVGLAFLQVRLHHREDASDNTTHHSAVM
ncbi:MAG: manganese efflux pump, partial [Escherichia coli]|nr:manganese efflux pump [Escherichia coli]